MSEVIQYATPDQLATIDELVSRMLRAVDGESGSLVATAALRIATGLWKMGGVERFHAEVVISQHLDHVYEDAGKPN